MQQTGPEGEQEPARINGEGETQGTVQATKIKPYRQMVYAQTSICPEK